MLTVVCALAEWLDPIIRPRARVHMARKSQR
jgi:hypothetical protein